MATLQVSPRAPTADWALTGAVFGFVAGITMAMFEMIFAAAMGMSALAPLRMIAGIALGADVAAGAGSTATAVIVGMLVHFALSALYGTVFAALVSFIPNLRSSKSGIAAFASVFGLALWLVNFYVIAPALFPWFTEANPLAQFIGHTFFYGAVLGGLIDAKLKVPARGDVTVT